MTELSSTYSDAEYESLLENFKWCAAVLNVLVQEAGGVVEIGRDELETMDLRLNVIQVRAEGDKYIVESVEADDAV